MEFIAEREDGTEAAVSRTDLGVPLVTSVGNIRCRYDGTLATIHFPARSKRPLFTYDTAAHRLRCYIDRLPDVIESTARVEEVAEEKEKKEKKKKRKREETAGEGEEGHERKRPRGKLSEEERAARYARMQAKGTLRRAKKAADTPAAVTAVPAESSAPVEAAPSPSASE